MAKIYPTFDWKHFQRTIDHEFRFQVTLHIIIYLPRGLFDSVVMRPNTASFWLFSYFPQCNEKYWIKYDIKRKKWALGIEHRAAEWWAQSNPFSLFWVPFSHSEGSAWCYVGQSSALPMVKIYHAESLFKATQRVGNSFLDDSAQ